MRSENFVAFFTVSGFFIGLSFSLLKANDLEEFLFFIFGITLFFYLFVHLVLIFFFSVEPAVEESFDKLSTEAMINELIDKLKKREQKVEQIIRSLKDLKSS